MDYNNVISPAAENSLGVNIAEKGNRIILSLEAKKIYLTSLIGKMLKILHLCEEEKVTGYSPLPFIAGQLFEINAANKLFDGELVGIIVKLKGVYDEYKTMPFDKVKKQIFEIKRILNSLLVKLGV